MVHFSQHMIAAGWDAIDDDMDFIGELQPVGDVAFSEPVGANHGFKEGDFIPGLDMMTTRVGINRQTFVMGMTFPQYLLMQTNYCNGGNSGKVTVKTRWRNNAYAKYNCTLVMDLEGAEVVWAGYKNVRWTYFDLQAIV